MPESQETRSEYEARLHAREAVAKAHRTVERGQGYARLGLALVAVLVGWLAYMEHMFSPGWIGLPLAAFTFVVVRNHLTTEARIRAERAAQYYASGLRRLDGTWSGHGAEGKRFWSQEHLYAADLDLFGEGSLFQLLCRARTRAGEHTLADWLRTAAEPEVVRERQKAITALKGRLDFLESLAVIGEALKENMEPDPLRTWAAGEAPPQRSMIAVRVLPLVSIALFIAGPWIGPWIGILAVLGQMAYAYQHRTTVRPEVEAAIKAAADLDLLVALFELMEGPDGAARELARLRAIIDRLEARSNPFFLPIAALLLWTTRHAFSIEAWRTKHGANVAVWLDAAGEMEALASLATHAREHPEDAFPELVDGAVFDAKALGHPLLPRDDCVCNDVALSAEAPLLLVSGSNMSGKSTFLRATGTAAVMAYAGGTVRAKSLRIGRLTVGASILARDSIQDGTSRFYAEITRLRNIVTVARERPTLYLLDELLMGTNSEDRRVGAEALMRGLVATGSLGLVTTHDLALTHVAGGRNVHFSDQMQDGEMSFDHVLREGVVTKSNALALMRAVGLDV